MRVPPARFRPINLIETQCPTLTNPLARIALSDRGLPFTKEIQSPFKTYLMLAKNASGTGLLARFLNRQPAFDLKALRTGWLGIDF